MSTKKALPLKTALVILLSFSIFLLGTGWLIKDVVKRNANSSEDKLYQEALKLSRESKPSKDVSAQVNLGWQEFKKANYVKAEQFYQEALKNSPEDLAANYNLALVYAETGRFEESKYLFNKVINMSPKHSLAYYNLGLVYKLQGDYENAEKVLRKSLEFDKAQGNIYFELATVYEAMNKNSEAIEFYQQSLKFLPDLVEANEALVRLNSSKK